MGAEGEGLQVRFRPAGTAVIATQPPSLKAVFSHRQRVVWQFLQKEEDDDEEEGEEEEEEEEGNQLGPHYMATGEDHGLMARWQDGFDIMMGELG